MYTYVLCNQSVSAAALGPKSSTLLILGPTEPLGTIPADFGTNVKSDVTGRPGERINDLYGWIVLVMYLNYIWNLTSLT